MGESFDEEPFLGEKNLANVLLASWEPCCEFVTYRSWEKKGIVGGEIGRKSIDWSLNDLKHNKMVRKRFLLAQEKL